MVNPMFEPNEKICIDLISGRKVEGEFVQMNKTGIILKNGKELSSGKRYRQNSIFYFPEIHECFAVNACDRREQQNTSEDMPNNNESGQSTSSNQHNYNSSDSKSRSNIKSAVQIVKKSFDDGEIERIQNLMKNAVYISQFDDKYYDAINDMKHQKIIAVNSENTFGRLNPMRPLIAITNGHQVYLFDMLRLGAMKKELKEIFAARSPCKIIHRSTHFNDYLLHTEKCTLANAFDTLMAHFTLKQTRECISLLDCLKIYFDLPESSFDFAAKNFNFGARPLQRDALLRSALNVQLLFELYWHLNDILMTPLRIATQQFSQIYPSIENQVDLMAEMTNDAYPGVENIDINAAKELEKMFGDFLID